MLQVFGGGWEEPLFIPLGFAEEESRRRYELTDPEFQGFLKFNKDGKKMRAARGESYSYSLLMWIEQCVEIRSLAS